MASLFTLMPAGAGPIPLERLEAAADGEDVLVDCLIDEELFWLRGDEEPDPVFDEPYLSQLSGEAREAALDSGLRSLTAKGMVDVDPDDPDTVEVLGVYSLLAECRRAAASVTRAVLDVAGEAPVRFAFRRVSDTLVLVEEVSDDGFHDFAFQSLDSAAATLSSIFDRRRSAGSESGPHVSAGSPEELDPSPSALAADASHVVSVVSKGRGLDGAPHALSMTVYGKPDGVWSHWVDPTSAAPHVMARTGAPDLFVLAADALTGRNPTH